jgi:hypothetical protein
MQTAVCTTFANARHKATQAQSNIYYSFWNLAVQLVLYPALWLKPVVQNKGHALKAKCFLYSISRWMTAP